MNNIKETEIKLHSTMDAQIWADVMCKTFKKVHNISLDNEAVYGWMCNAIMCGYDHAHWKRNEEYIYILQSHAGPIIQVFHYEPNDFDMDDAYMYYLNDNNLDAGVAKTNCVLYRWAKDKGLMVWNGERKDDSKYDWSVA